MPKYINADKLIDEIVFNELDVGIIESKEVIDIIQNMPSADVVEGVRCKDCKHLVGIDPDNLYVCDRIDIGMDGEPSFLNPKTDFCSYGERKETE